MRARPLRLAPLFDKLATAAFAGAAALACGGSSSSSTPTIDKGTYPDPVCDGTTYLPVHGLKPGTAVDFVELRQEYQNGAGPGTAPTTLDQEGAACSTAKDHIACASKLDNVRSTTGWSPASGGGVVAPVEYLVTTAGDAVATVTTNAALFALLGPIDNAKKAALVLSLNGHGIVCGTSSARAASGGGYDVIVLDSSVCAPTYEVVEHVAPDGTITEVTRDQAAPGPTGPCATGRRPDGLVASGRPFDRDVGEFFAEVARLEAASVTAFARLARDLRAHGAPRRLVRLAERAAKDEVRHARAMTRLARRFGAAPSAPTIGRARRRSLAAIARENAVEGCVRETFGALLATWQARAATDPEVRAAMRTIARDETAHAELSFRLARWIEPRLSPAARARIARAKTRAIEELERDAARPAARAIHERAGLPPPAVARALLDGVRRELWAA